MFKRRTPRSTVASLARAVWPAGGWIRALRYMAYRLRRLPDPAYKISRGMAVGVFVCFTPLFGLHFLVSAGLAWIIGGNVLAALLATFFGNPVTFPIIAGLSVGLGTRILGIAEPLPLGQVFDAFSRVSLELWANAQAVFTPAPVVWTHLDRFLTMVFWPYMVGGTLLGIVAGVVTYAASRPLIAAYQRARISRLKRAFAERRMVGQRREGQT